MFIEQFLTRWINPSEATRHRSIRPPLQYKLLKLEIARGYDDSVTIERGREREGTEFSTVPLIESARI